MWVAGLLTYYDWLVDWLARYIQLSEKLDKTYYRGVIINNTHGKRAAKWRTQQTQNICITFIQRRHNVFGVGPTLHKCYTDGLRSLGIIWQKMFMFCFTRCIIKPTSYKCVTASRMTLLPNCVNYLCHLFTRWCWQNTCIYAHTAVQSQKGSICLL